MNQEIVGRTYVVMTSLSGNYRHLGSTEHGMRTYCGKLFSYTNTLIEKYGSIDVSCLICRRTAHYRLAEVLRRSSESMELHPKR